MRQGLTRGKEFTKFPLYEFSGTWREIGQQFGEELREEIQGMFPWWYDVLHTIYDDSLEDMVALCGKFADPIKAQFPDSWEELQGIAEGAGITINEALFIQGGWEIDGSGPGAFVNGGCTDFAVGPEATKFGNTIVGQNFDWYPDAPTIVTRIKPNNRESFLACTWPGHLGQVGISEGGYGMFINILAVKNNGRVGVPYSVLCNEALSQKCVGDVIRTLVQGNSASSFDFTIAGSKGEMINVELAANKDGVRVGFVEPEGDILAHSNHYVTDYLAADDINYLTSFPDSRLRRYRMQQLLEQRRGELTPELIMKEVLTDDRGYPDAINRRCDVLGPVAEQFETCFSCVALPAEGKMYATWLPGENPYSLYTL